MQKPRFSRFSVIKQAVTVGSDSPRSHSARKYWNDAEVEKVKNRDSLVGSEGSYGCSQVFPGCSPGFWMSSGGYRAVCNCSRVFPRCSPVFPRRLLESGFCDFPILADGRGTFLEPSGIHVEPEPTKNKILIVFRTRYKYEILTLPERGERSI